MPDTSGKRWRGLYVKDGVLYMRIKDRIGKWVGRSTHCRVGDEKKADQIRRKTQAALQAEVEVAPEGGPVTVLRYGERWIKARQNRGLASVKDDASSLRHYVYPTFGEMLLREVRPRHIRDWVHKLINTPSRRQGKLAPRTVRKAYALFHTMMREAVVDELIDANPVVVKAHVLPGIKDKDPHFRRGAFFTPEEIVSLITDALVPEDRRVLYSILFLTGVRFGEMAALRWRDYDAAFAPLGKLHVSAAYSTRHKTVKETKTGVVREVPVHPILAGILADWKQGGWRRLMGRDPHPDDLIVPSRGQGKRPSGHRSVNHMMKKFRKDTGKLNMPPRRQHDARRTLISLARAGGANPDALKVFTHGSSKQILDLYTTFPWTALCDALLCVSLPMATPQRPGTDCDATGLAAIAQQPLSDACYALATVVSEDGPENEKGPQPWMVASLVNWRGVRDSNPWPPA